MDNHVITELYSWNRHIDTFILMCYLSWIVVEESVTRQAEEQGSEQQSHEVGYQAAIDQEAEQQQTEGIVEQGTIAEEAAVVDQETVTYDGGAEQESTGEQPPEEKAMDAESEPAQSEQPEHATQSEQPESASSELAVSYSEASLEQQASEPAPEQEETDQQVPEQGFVVVLSGNYAFIN